MRHLTPRLLLACVWLACVLAVTQIYDETLWTKQLWTQRWKLDKSLFSTNPTEENPGLITAYPDIRDAYQNSLDGPEPKSLKKAGRADVFDAEALDDQALLQPAAQAVKCTVCNTLVTRVWQHLVVDLLRGLLKPSTAAYFIPKYLTEACEKEVVSLLQRTVIYRMDMDNLAHSMTFFVLRKRKAGTTPTQAERSAVRMACKDILQTSKGDLVTAMAQALTDFKQDLNALLTKHGLVTLPDMPEHPLQQQLAAQAAQAIQADVDNAQAALGMPADDALPEPAAAGAVGADTGAVVGDAAADNAAAAAGAAAAVADAAAAGAGGGVVQVQGDPGLDHMVEKLLKGLASQLKREGVMLQFESGVEKRLPGEDDDEYGDPDDDDDDEDDYEEGDVDCIDLHPQCQHWANEGECEANPNYMVGTAKLKGHCRRACGLCTPTALTPQEVLKSHPALAKEVQTLSNNMLQIVKTLVCTGGQACMTGSSSISMDGSTVTPKVAVEMQQSSGFVLGRPSWGYPEVRETPASRAVAIKQAEELAATAAKQQGDNDNDNDLTTKDALHREVDHVLSRELGGKLLHLRTEFFTYEFLYKNHTRHFAQDPNNKAKLIEDWMLGTFQRESVAVESSTASGDGLAVLHPRDLLPDHTDVVKMGDRSWPYVKQVYANGDVCTLAGGRRVVRRTEARIACSPDNKLHLLVREPDFCHYIFVIYTPGLCSLMQYQPTSQPTPTS